MIFHDSVESVVIKKRFVIIVNFWLMNHHSQVLNFNSIGYNHGSPSFFSSIMKCFIYILRIVLLAINLLRSFDVFVHYSREIMCIN